MFFCYFKHAHTQLTGYSIFLAILWLVVACFAIIPIYVWTCVADRCDDLENTESNSEYDEICFDLVQFGWFLSLFFRLKLLF